jgi:hypothetical protein
MRRPVEMFQKTGPNTVTSDEGFSVEVLGRTGLRYTEGDRVMRIDSEFLVGPHGMAVFGPSVQAWEPPHEGDAVDDGERARILDNVRRAFKFEGFDIEVY